MQIEKFLPLVYELLEQNPAIKEEAIGRSKIVLYLRLGKIEQARTEAQNKYPDKKVLDALEGVEEGTVVTFEKMGEIYYVSRERVRQVLHDLVVFVGIKHLENLQVEKRAASGE